MKISNRLWGVLILAFIILFIYLFYKYFFSVKLSYLEINSNVWNYEVIINNIKFKKNITCENKKCIIKEIPPFEYNIIIKKENYKTYSNKINILKNNKINILLEKVISLEIVDEKKLTRFEIINNIQSKKKINLLWENIKSNKVLSSNKYLYFKKDNKLYINNSLNNNLIKSDFVPDIKYIKKLDNNNLLIVTEEWSFILNLLNKEINYFSLFSDFIKIDNNYIWIINYDDLIRKKNFWYENIDWNLIILYNINRKISYILKNIWNKIEKIYIENNKLYIENNLWEKFKINWYIDN